MCSNNVESYACACKAGFTGDGYTCTGEPFKSNVKRLFDMSSILGSKISIVSVYHGLARSSR